MIVRAQVVWKNESGRVIIMAKKGIYLLNKDASELWRSVGKLQNHEYNTVADTLVRDGLLERIDD